MTDLIKKTILAGLGALSLTREKAEEISRDLIKRGELAKTDEAKFVRDLMDLVEKNRAGMEEKIEKAVDKAMAKLDIPSRKEINALKEEISKLTKRDKASGK
jgi:poly(hydroxyalkanoate) granule-associated protein